MIKIGRVGPGRPWDDGFKNKVSRIFISHGQKVHSLQFQYVENGAYVLSEKHGGDSGPSFDVVILDHDNECITTVGGTVNYDFSDINSNSSTDFCVTSITFTTNKNTYGPFGCAHKYDRPFSYKTVLGFGGFYGSSSHNLNSIGVHVNSNKA